MTQHPGHSGPRIARPVHSGQPDPGSEYDPGPRAFARDRAHPMVPPPLARAGLDRNSGLRLDELGLAAAWSNPDTRVLVISAGQAFVIDEADPRPDTEAAPSRAAAPAWAATQTRTKLVTIPSYEAPDGDRYLLGRDERGAMYFAVPAESLPGRLDGDARPATLREVGVLLDDLDASLFAHAVGLEHWHRTHGFCPNCGGATESAAAGHLRRCSRCGTEHYPRTDPAVIMAVTDGPLADEPTRLLFGRGVSWDPCRFSVLAGFVEPGESLEQAVAREVFEEAGLTVTGATYLGSQPWPFPASIMLGFTARASDPDRLLADGTEVQELRWYSRAGLTQAIAAGDVIPTNRLSIARALIEHWYGGPLPEAPAAPKR